MALRLIFGLPAVVVCLLATASMAFRFGWTLGAEEIDRWMYAGAGVAVDVIKALLPLMILWAWHAVPRRWGYCLVAGVFFALFTGYSLLCSFGLAAIQAASKSGAHTAVATAYQDGRATLGRLSAQRAALAFTTTNEAAVGAAQRAADTATQSRLAECGNGAPAQRGNNCRAREADERNALAALAAATTNKAVTDKAADLDAKIAAAQAALAKMDVKEATRAADPQAAALASLVGRLVGNDQERIRSAIHALLALVLEAGSGFGFYLVFGSHSLGQPRREGRVERPTPVAAPEPVEYTSIETADEAVTRFFRERVCPSRGDRVVASDMHADYASWCGETERDPLSSNAFGRIAPWRRVRSGGRVWYLDAKLVNAPALRLAVSNEAPAERAARWGAW